MVKPNQKTYFTNICLTCWWYFLSLILTWCWWPDDVVVKLTWARLFITLITWLLWHKWWSVITESRCSHPTSRMSSSSKTAWWEERGFTLGIKYQDTNTSSYITQFLSENSPWRPVLPDQTPLFMNIFSNITVAGLDQRMHKFQVMIICCPWIDHQSYCSIPTLLLNWSSLTQMLKHHSKSPSFSGQFLTWSFSAPISCLVLNGFHSCFLKPKSRAGVSLL